LSQQQLIPSFNELVEYVNKELQLVRNELGAINLAAEGIGIPAIKAGS
jgi:hypothetical protein